MTAESQVPGQGEGIDVRAGQGVQIGGKDQYNVWMVEHRLDADTLASFSPAAAAAHLAEIPHRDAVILLATAPADVSAEILAVLLSVNEDLAVSILADVNPRKFREIVSAIPAAPAWLKALPTAVAEMARCENGQRPALGERAGRLTHVGPSLMFTEGYYQGFSRGVVCWSDRVGAQAITGAIAECHEAHGGIPGLLGFPLTGEASARSPFGTVGSWQRFESMSYYGRQTCDRLGSQCGASVYTSSHGTYATWGAIGECYELAGGSGGWLGFPVSAQTQVDARPAGWYQRFEGGAIYLKNGTDEAFAVSSLVFAYNVRQDRLRYGFPAGPESDAATSPFGTTGRKQRFDAGSIYTSDAHGVHGVRTDTRAFYEQLGDTAGWLGFPTADGNSAPSPPWERPSGKAFQEFEGGRVFLHAGNGPVAVPQSTMEFLSHHGSLEERLGFPVAAEMRIGTATEDRIQFFEHGVVTVRGGKVEAWLRAGDS